MIDRRQISTLVLLALTAVFLYVCYLITLPFLPALVLALALSVAAFPVHQRIENLIKKRGFAAAISALLIALLVVVPLFFVCRQIIREASRNAVSITREIESGEWRTQIKQNGRLAPILQWLETELDLRGLTESIVEKTPSYLSKFFVGSGWFIAELLVAFVALFYFFRDREAILLFMRRLLPLRDAETDGIFKTVNDTIYATVTGVFIVSIAQGTLAGLMFWLLGLPAPIMWGLIMAVLAMLPFVGTWMIWIPAAAYLALNGNYIKALILIGWGITAVSLIDNLIYPILVGDRLRLHTLSVFFALLGGLVLFGAIGIILGPLVLALTVALLEIWRGRMTVEAVEDVSNA